MRTDLDARLCCRALECGRWRGRERWRSRCPSAAAPSCCGGRTPERRRGLLRRSCRSPSRSSARSSPRVSHANPIGWIFSAASVSPALAGAGARLRGRPRTTRSGAGSSASRSARHGGLGRAGRRRGRPAAPAVPRRPLRVAPLAPGGLARRSPHRRDAASGVALATAIAESATVPHPVAIDNPAGSTRRRGSTRCRLRRVACLVVAGRRWSGASSASGPRAVTSASR